MKYILNFPADKKVYVIGEKGIEDELDSVGIRHCGGTVSLSSFASRESVADEVG